MPNKKPHVLVCPDCKTKWNVETFTYAEWVQCDCGLWQQAPPRPEVADEDYLLNKPPAMVDRLEAK